jgi:tRNA threonylcarbamoyladenosine biosynthesis protein TsaE
MIREWLCRDERESARAGAEIALLLAPDSVVHLIGDLGAGKTFLARAIASARGADAAQVASPSFAIVHEYPVPGEPPIIHVDGYRLSESRREWLEIGIDEILAAPGLKLVEWPKTSFEEFESGHVEVEITVEPDDSRKIVLRS